jgi:hypothetical protein
MAWTYIRRTENRLFVHVFRLSGVDFHVEHEATPTEFKHRSIQILDEKRSHWKYELYSEILWDELYGHDLNVVKCGAHTMMVIHQSSTVYRLKISRRGD